MFPFLLFLLSLLAYTPVSAFELTENILKLMPGGAGKFISDVITEILKTKSPVLLSISAIITLWSASGGISALSRGLNKAYDKEESRSFFRLKIVSVLFIIGMAVIVIITLIFLVFGGVIGSFISGLFSSPAAFMILWEALRYAIPPFILFFMFALLYIFVPCCGIRFKEALPGAVFSTISWIITSLLFSLYVSDFVNYTKIYGSIGGIIIFLLWLYISCIIIILGGEVNATFSYYKNGVKKDKYENQRILPEWLRKRINKK
jgi:membrane protein